MRRPLLTIRRLRFLAASLLLACGALPAAAQSPSSAVVEYYHLDALGSVRAVTDATGAVVRRHDYFPFGEEAAPPPGADPLRFAGKARDAETGLDYFRARYYASRAGRFTTVDPEHVGGNIFDPQSWNAYAYARNNPFRFVDPSGTDYFVNVDGGEAFWFEGGYTQFSDFASGYRLIGGSEGGFIQNAAGRIVGSYRYFDPFGRVVFESGRRAAPGVNLAAGAFITFASIVAPVPMMIVGCGASWADCSSSSSGLAMALSPKAAKILRNLAPLAGKTVAQVIRLRGGGGSQVQQVATDLQHLPLGEVAERAARGDEAAMTAIKIAKDAKRLSEKY